MRLNASSPPADAPTPATRNAGPSGAGASAGTSPGASFERGRFAIFGFALALALAFAFAFAFRFSVRLAFCFVTFFVAIALDQARRASPFEVKVDASSRDRNARWPSNTLVHKRFHSKTGIMLSW